MKTEDYMKTKLRLLGINTFLNLMKLFLMIYAVGWLFANG